MKDKSQTALENSLSEYYSRPTPSQAFAARLRAQLIEQADAQPSLGAGIWSHLGAAGRVGFSLAGAALMVGLVLLGASLLYAHLGLPGTTGAAGFPSTAAPATPTSSTVATTPTPGYTPAHLAPAACQTVITPAPFNAAYSGPGTLIAGGAVTSGDFQINLFLYCDDTLRPDSQQYSEIAGLGVYTSSWYHGPELAGEVSVAEGIQPFVRQISGAGPLHNGLGISGAKGFQIDPSIYPDWRAADIPLRYVYEIRDPRGHYSGAALSFHLVASPEGLLVQGAQVAPLSQAELTTAGIPAAGIPAVKATPTLSFPTLNPASLNGLLNELKALRDRFLSTFYTGPGWVHSRAHISLAQSSASPTPNGQATMPQEYDYDQWFLVTKDGNPISGVARYIDASGKVSHTSILTKDGAWHDLNTGNISSADYQEPPVFDDGFYNDAARSVIDGGNLTKSTPAGQDPTRTVQYTLVLRGQKAEAVFDLQTGTLRSLTYSLQDGKQRVSTYTTIVIERATEAPQEILHLLAQP